MRTIIITDVMVTNHGGDGNYDATAVLWLRAPRNRILQRPTAQSAVIGVTDEELAEIRSGRIVEQTLTTSAGFATDADLKANLESEYSNRQGLLDATAAPSDLILTHFDGQTWNAR